MKTWIPIKRVVLVLALVACERRSGETPSLLSAVSAPSSMPPAPAASATPPMGATPPLTPPPFTLGPAPGASGVTREQREQAVLDLLSGGELAASLPEHALDPGKAER